MILEQLDKGSFGSVYKCQKFGTNEYYAVKVAFLSK